LFTVLADHVIDGTIYVCFCLYWIDSFPNTLNT